VRRTATAEFLVRLHQRRELDRLHPLRVLLEELPKRWGHHAHETWPIVACGSGALAEPVHVDAADLSRKTAGNAFFVTEATQAGDVRIPSATVCPRAPLGCALAR
jgi:hypothetical protein